MDSEDDSFHLLEFIVRDGMKRVSYWHVGDKKRINTSWAHYETARTFAGDPIIGLRRYVFAVKPEPIQSIDMVDPDEKKREDERAFYKNAEKDALHNRPGRGVAGILEDVRALEGSEK